MKLYLNPISGSLEFLQPGPAGVQGVAGSTGSRLLDEITSIYTRGTFSIGTPGQVPFGVGPVPPASGSYYFIGPDLYNAIHIQSGSLC
jgi:hypothetical protein